MKRPGSRWGRFARWLLCAGLAGSSGCLGFLHPITVPPADLVESCHELPTGCRGHVYIFFLNGLDPTDQLYLSGMRRYVNRLGFPKTYSGQVYHSYSFAREVRRIHRDDAEAHFVFVGSPTAIRATRSLLPAAEKDAIPVDFIAYFGSGEAGAADGSPSGGSVVWVAPGQADTVGLLAQELTQIASAVPVMERTTPAATKEIEEAPTPRPVTPQAATPRDEWDFLKPVLVLRPFADAERPAPQTDEPPRSEKPSGSDAE